MDYFGRASNAKEETTKKTAVEKINLKITTAQMKGYAETQTIPTLQYIANELCEDDDIEYVTLKEEEQASLEKIIVGETDSILTKLKEYPYEFEVDKDLKLASINGTKIADNSSARIKELEQQIAELKAQNIEGYYQFVKGNNGFTATRGEVEFGSLGIIPKTYKDVGNEKYLYLNVEKALDAPLKLNNKFEISTELSIDNSNVKSYSNFSIILYKENENQYVEVGRLFYSDAWSNSNKNAYRGTINGYEVKLRSK